MSGTSMAAPHISGLIAYFIARDGNTTPSLMMDKIQGAAQKGVLANIRVSYIIYFDRLLLTSPIKRQVLSTTWPRTFNC